MTVLVEYIPAMIAVATFLSISMLLLGAYQFSRLRGEKRAKIEKIQQGGRRKTVDIYTTPLEETGGGIQGTLLRLLGSFGKRLATKRAADLSTLRPMFLKAGIRHPNAPAAFWGAKVLFALLFPACFIVFQIFFSPLAMPHGYLVAFIVLLALAGFYSPTGWLLLKTARRQEKIRDGFADALDLLVVCVEAGMGLDGAIHRTAKEIALDSKVLSEEFNLMNLELRAGKSRRDALKNLAMRTGLEDVSSLVTLLIQTDKLGTSVAQALRVYSDTFRTKRYMKAEEQAAKIPVKLTIPMILFIFPALLIAIMGPAFIRIGEALLPALGR
ncbi:MAG: type II secretion system F family protein [Desulfobacterales bacterium]|nr:MAG: type II secretion system F family protein [Desulfobacterales bacterium]